MTFQKLHRSLTKLVDRLVNNFVLGDEAALVVSWWDILVMTVFTMLVFIFFGPVVDSVYIFINGTVNNSLTNNFYTQSDMHTVTDLYNCYQWVPYIAIGVVVFYALNYSSMKKGGE